MTTVVSIIAAVAAIASVIVSTTSFFYVRKSQKTSVYQHVSGLYDKLVGFRIDHPEVLSLSRRWDQEKMVKVYRPTSDEDKDWARYFTYVELCIGYCNAVLHARNKKFMEKDDYLNQHEPLMKLLLTEHNPLIESLVIEKEFISKYIQDFRKDLEEKGWNWKERYRYIDRIPSTTLKRPDSKILNNP